MGDFIFGIVTIAISIYFLQDAYRTWDEKSDHAPGNIANPQIVMFAILGIIAGLLLIARGCGLEYQ